MARPAIKSKPSASKQRPTALKDDLTPRQIDEMFKQYSGGRPTIGSISPPLWNPALCVDNKLIDPNSRSILPTRLAISFEYVQHTQVAKKLRQTSDSSDYEVASSLFKKYLEYQLITGTPTKTFTSLD